MDPTDPEHWFKFWISALYLRDQRFKYESVNSVQAGEHAVREGSAGGGVPRLSPPLLLPLLREHHGRREGGKTGFFEILFPNMLFGFAADVKKYYGITQYLVLRIRIRDPVIFYPWIRDPGWKKSGSGIRDEHPRSFFRELRNSFRAKNT
jgi:hypothetical protein